MRSSRSFPEESTRLRILALVDGEHYPPVVRAAIEALPPNVVGAALLGGTEKLVTTDLPDLGVPVVTGPTPEAALAVGLDRFAPDLVYDLSDEPVLDARRRLRLVALTLARGTSYRGADFEFVPPARPRVATKPTIAVIGIGKRTGKTAAAAHLARLLRENGRPPVMVTMGRGGPPEPELVDPDTFDLSPAGLVALAATGRHAASDHLEDALMARVATVGTRRCGGGLAGTPADSTFAAGVEVANRRPEALMILEGSGAAIPPVHADATVCIVSAQSDPELVTGYVGLYPLLLSDLIVVTMAETSLADSGAAASLERDVLGLVRGGMSKATAEPRVVLTVFRPFPLHPISGRRVFYATTAPAPAVTRLAEHLEHEHGAEVVGTSHHLAHRQQLAADLEKAERADVLVAELKAAAVDLAARVALQRGMEVVFCDNRLVAVGGDGPFDDLALQMADLAEQRFSLST
jgi:cyclic 2,3-diphosphoglycerate synthetase